MKQKAKETHSSEFCVLPKYLTIENLFDCYQHYETVEHLLGITTNENSWEKVRIYNYNNSVFKGILSFCHNYIYGQILTHININGKDYYSCNGLCSPNESTQILEIYKAVKEHSGKKYPTQNDFDRYMFSKIVTNPEIKS